MKNQPTSKKSIITIVVIVVVAALAYFYFSGGSTPAPSGLVQSQALGSANVGTRVLSLLNQIRSLKIDTSIFKGAAYRSLMDYTVAIPEVEVGRPNPFEPIPGMPVTPAK